MNFKIDVQYRKKVLQRLLESIQLHEKDVIVALHKDFKKPAFETVLTETNYVIRDLKSILKNIESWAKPKKVCPSILNFPSSDFILSEPYGNVLIIAPWNYPFQLAMSPLIAAIASGNKVTLKPSELAQNTATVIAKIIRETFETSHAVAILGDSKMGESLLEKRWDYIFFTGSVRVGKIVAQKAAEHLTPVTLELGGKNPCIIEKTANLRLAAKRIVWGKFLNVGQTCIAPDYLLVQNDIKIEFTKLLIKEIKIAYGENPQKSDDYARIINLANWKRLCGYLDDQKIVYGGQTSELDHYIAPTICEIDDLNSDIMQNEIFGPLLPIISFKTENDLEKIILQFEKPLALYVFSTNNKFSNKMITRFSFGGGCINDTVVQVANKRLPFGGVGHSGIGAYHGKMSFDLFSHKKSIVKKANWLDIPIRYAPYGNKLNWIKKILEKF